MINLIIIYIFFFFITNELIFFDSEKIIILGFFILIFCLMNLSKEFFNSMFNIRRKELKDNFYSYYNSIINLLNILINLNSFYKIFFKNLKSFYNSFILLIVNKKIFNFNKSEYYNLIFLKNLSLNILYNFNLEMFIFIKLLLNKILIDFIFNLIYKNNFKLHYNINNKFLQFKTLKFF